MTERQARLLALLEIKGEQPVVGLAERLAVSQVTLRKDLDGLVAQGLVQRAHGSAAIVSRDDLRSRLAYHHEAKRRIARRAAADVADGETVMIESGSCCALLADELANTKRDITIVTNSAFIAGYLRETSARVLLLGGEYQPAPQVMVGPLVRLCAREFRVGRFFFGIDGFDASLGLMGRDERRAEAVRAMSEQADSAFVLTEADKFARRGTAVLMPLAAVSGVYTDDGLHEAVELDLTYNGVSISKVEGHEHAAVHK